MTLQFLGEYHPSLPVLLAVLLAGLAWLLYRRDVDTIQSKFFMWTLRTLRALAVFLIALTLAEPILESRTREGNPGRVVFILDDSESMSTADQRGSDDARFQRVSDYIAAPEVGLVHQLADSFEIEVARTSGSDLQTLWHSSTDPKRTKFEAPDWDPSQWLPASWAADTSLGEAMRAAVAGSGDGDSDKETFVVLLTDGQSNAGASPVQVANEMGSQNAPVFCVGIGNDHQQRDLTVLAASTSSRVFLEDTLRGSFTIKQSSTSDLGYSAEVLYDDQVLWQQTYEASASSTQQHSFSFPVMDLYELATEALGDRAEFAVLPTKLTVRVNSADDPVSANDTKPIYTSVSAQKAKVLLVDGRSRWESRYLKNLFERDPAWELVNHIAPPGSQAATDFLTRTFPKTKHELFQFNLIILGEMPPDTLRPQHLDWIKEFVEVAGGGLILLDGARGYLRRSQYDQLTSLMPIRWTHEIPTRDALPKSAALTEAGKRLGTFQLAESPGSQDDTVWGQLSPIEFVAQTVALPGSEVLVNATSDLDTSPLFVSRRFGAGRVLYCATDETWKWRFKVADKHHTRLWNQLARYVMRTPYSLEGEFISLDTGKPNYEPGSPIEIRCQLRSSQLQPATGLTASTVVRDIDGNVVARLPLSEDPNVPGAYRATIGDLPSGDYSTQIEAAGFPRDALQIESRFSVLTPESLEMTELSCNTELLQRIADASGGSYIHESDIGTLAKQLRPLSGGKFVWSTNLIWQSYWWFSLAMALLIGEWWLRKRAGLI